MSSVTLVWHSVVKVCILSKLYRSTPSFRESPMLEYSNLYDTGIYDEILLYNTYIPGNSQVDQTQRS